MNNNKNIIKMKDSLNRNENTIVSNNDLNNNNNSSNNKTIVLSIIVAILVLALAVVFYLLAITNCPKTEESLINDVNSQEKKKESDDKPEVNTTNDDLLKYIDPNEVYGFYSGMDYNYDIEGWKDNPIYVELLLYNDNSYIMHNCYMACTFEEGTYTIINNKLYLDKAKYYGSDSLCLNTEYISENTINGENLNVIVSPNYGFTYSILITLKKDNLSNLTSIVNAYRDKEFHDDCISINEYYNGMH